MPIPNNSELTKEEINALKERIINFYPDINERKKIIEEIFDQPEKSKKFLTRKLYNTYFTQNDIPLKNELSNVKINNLVNQPNNIDIIPPPKLLNNAILSNLTNNNKSENLTNNNESENLTNNNESENLTNNNKSENLTNNGKGDGIGGKSIFDNEVTQEKIEPSISKQLERLKNVQLGVETGRLGGDIYNLIREINRGTSVPYKGATFSFTPTPSSRDMMLKELNKDVSSGEAKMMRFIESQGLTDVVGGVLAQSNEAINKGTPQIASNVLQSLSSDAQRFDQYRNMQSQADAQTFNLNVQKQAQENQISGQLIGALQDRIYNNITDVNRQNYEYAKIKKFLDENNNSVTSLIEAENYLRAKYPDLYEENKDNDNKLNR